MRKIPHNIAMLILFSALLFSACTNTDARYLKEIDKRYGPLSLTPLGWAQAALAGDTQAQQHECLEYGIDKKGIAQSYYEEVVRWCRNEANKGDLAAMDVLGHVYEKGDAGFSQSWVDAYFWYSARRISEKDSMFEINRVEKYLTKEQLSQADERVKAWKKDICKTHPASRRERTMRDWHCAATIK